MITPSQIKIGMAESTEQVPSKLLKSMPLRVEPARSAHTTTVQVAGQRATYKYVTAKQTVLTSLT